MEGIINDRVFLKLLQELAQTGAPASLFVDDGGIGSEQGQVASVYHSDGVDRVQLTNGKSFAVAQIMAINGLMRTGFSMC